jgi:hypothetical protein
MKVKENKSYFDRLLFYKGIKKETDLVNVEKATDLEIATVGYGIANWYLYNGDRAKRKSTSRKSSQGNTGRHLVSSPLRLNWHDADRIGRLVSSLADSRAMSSLASVAPPDQRFL